LAGAKLPSKKLTSDFDNLVHPTSPVMLATRRARPLTRLTVSPVADRSRTRDSHGGRNRDVASVGSTVKGAPNKLDSKLTDNGGSPYDNCQQVELPLE
jgi:hypothetical protein